MPFLLARTWAMREGERERVKEGYGCERESEIERWREREKYIYI